MSLNYVPPDGPLDASLAYVGARPGWDEKREGRGFTGPSGYLLWKLSKLPRNQCYVTNVRKDYSEKHSVPTLTEIKEAQPQLREELLRLQANILVAVGREAMVALTGKHEIDKWRGSVIESSLVPGKKVISTFHTAAALRSYSLRYIIDLDLRRAVRESRYPDIRRRPRTFHINRPFHEVVERLRSMKSPVTVDIETMGDEISVIGLTDSADYALCIPFIGGQYTIHELIYILRELDKLLRSVEINAQNISFDTSRLERLGLWLPKLRFDTMLAHHLLWTELGSVAKRKGAGFSPDEAAGKHKLEFLISCYTDIPFYKDQSERAWTDPTLTLEERFWQYWEYNCWDVVGEHECMEKLDGELIHFNQKTYFHEHVMALVRPVMTMQKRGVRIDTKMLERLRERITLECAYLQAVLNQQCGMEINVRSPLDMKLLMVEICGIPPNQLSYTPKRQVSTKEEHLRRIAYNSPHAGLIKLVLEIRERRTLLSNFLGLQPEEDGRYRAAFLIHGTGSGRLSSRGMRRGTGKGQPKAPQLQNIPKPPSKAKKAFVPSIGCCFVKGDYNRAEAMHVAYDSECQYLIEQFKDRNNDLYANTGKMILKKPVKKGTLEREAFKHIVLGANYGLGPDKLVVTLRLQGHIDIADVDIPGSSRRAKAKYALDAYFGLCPEIRIWQDKIWQQVCKTRVLYSDFGRRRIFLGRLDDASEEGERSTKNQALSYRAQASVVGMTNRAIRALDAMNCPLILQVHDELVIDSPLEQKDYWAYHLKKEMEYPVELHGRQLIIPVDVETSERSWHPDDMEKWSGAAAA